MHMGWGTRIVIAFVAGTCFLLYFVVRSMMITTEMTEDNYYAKELAFNTHIEGVDNAKKLAHPITIMDTAGIIRITIDSSIAASLENGEVHFYNAASEKADRKLPLKTASSGNYFYDKTLFNKGKYIVKLSFDYNKKPYYTEETIFIK